MTRVIKGNRELIIDDNDVGIYKSLGYGVIDLEPVDEPVINEPVEPDKVEKKKTKKDE